MFLKCWVGLGREWISWTFCILEFGFLTMILNSCDFSTRRVLTFNIPHDNVCIIMFVERKKKREISILCPIGKYIAIEDSMCVCGNLGEPTTTMEEPGKKRKKKASRTAASV